MTAPFPDTPYWQAYQGPFSGLLNWPDVERFWQVLAQDPQGWYAFDFLADPPQDVLSAQAFETQVQAMRELINSGRETSHCFALFADDVTQPDFVKIFDPGNLGASCGSSGSRTYPRWTLSRIAPTPLPIEPEEQPKPGFFGRLVRRSG